MDINKLKDALRTVIEDGEDQQYYSDTQIRTESSLEEYLNSKNSIRFGGCREFPAGEGGVVFRARTGGYDGGSCWGGEARPFTDEEGARARFTVLEDFAERFIPDITLRVFRRMARIVEEGDVTTNEYYGNSTSYKVSFLPISALASFIENEGLTVVIPDDGPEP